MSYLPAWMTDLATVLGIIGPTVAFLGWLVSGLAPPPRPAARRRAGHPEPVTGGLLRSVVTHLIMRPDVPLGQDARRVAEGYLVLIGMAVLYVWGASGPQPYNAPPIFHVVQQWAAYALLASAAFVVVLTARLFWKVEFMRRVRGGEYH